MQDRLTPLAMGWLQGPGRESLVLSEPHWWLRPKRDGECVAGAGSGCVPHRSLSWHLGRVWSRAGEISGMVKGWLAKSEEERLWEVVWASCALSAGLALPSPPPPRASPGLFRVQDAPSASLASSRPLPPHLCVISLESCACGGGGRSLAPLSSAVLCLTKGTSWRRSPRCPPSSPARAALRHRPSWEAGMALAPSSQLPLPLKGGTGHPREATHVPTCDFCFLRPSAVGVSSWGRSTIPPELCLPCSSPRGSSLQAASPLRLPSSVCALRRQVGRAQSEGGGHRGTQWRQTLPHP